MPPPAGSHKASPPGMGALSDTPSQSPAFYGQGMAEAVDHEDGIGMDKVGHLGLDLALIAVLLTKTGRHP